jgi:hypothetical protein
MMLFEYGDLTGESETLESGALSTSSKSGYLIG